MPRNEDDRDDRDDNRPRRRRDERSDEAEGRDDRPRRRRDDDDDDNRPRRRRDDDDDRDEDYRPRRRRSRDDDDTALGGLIPYKNGMALAAYYCGVFSFIPGVGMLLGPLAIIFGFLGLGKAKQHPEAKGKGHGIAGIVCGSLTSLGHLVVIAIVIAAAAKK